MSVSRTTAVALAAGLLLSACTAGGGEGPGGGPTPAVVPVVIDTDVGSDDVMAVLYLLSRPDVEVKAITVSGTGLAHCEPGVRTVLGLLELVAAPDVPVACGRETPLGGANAFPEEWRAGADAGYGLELPTTDRQPAEVDAVSVLSSAIRGADQPTLVALGPLTNVAEAFAEDPSLAREVEAVFAMGGALRAPGNVGANPQAEWNFHADPRAVDMVLRSGAEVTLVPLDMTNAVPVTGYFADALAGHHVTPQADAVLALFEHDPRLVEPGFFFWDPLAAVLSVEGVPATFERERVVVLEGSTDVDGELVLSSAGVEVRVASTGDPLAFETEFLNTLNGDEAIASTRPAPDLTFTLVADGCTGTVPTSLPAGTIDVAVENPLDVGGGVALATTANGHPIEELVAFVEGLEAAPTDEPPPWIVGEAWVDAAPGSTTLSPWELAPGQHAVVCVGESGSVRLAGVIDVEV